MFLAWPLALAILYLFGVYWCCVVIRCFPDDIRELREKRIAPKVAIIFVWLITVPIAVAMVVFTFVIIGRLAWLARELL